MKSLILGRYVFGYCAAVTMLAGCGGSQQPIAQTAAPAERPAMLPHQKTFHFTGYAQRFTVPSGVESITVVARGASGTVRKDGCTGKGGRVFALIPVVPKQRLFVFVGGAGQDSAGGFNGGASGAGGGGGASDVRTANGSLSDRIVVRGRRGRIRRAERRPQWGLPIGCGGGGGGDTAGTGTSGYYDGGAGGTGGTQTAGGIGGAGAKYGNPGANGAFYSGGGGASGTRSGGGPGGGGGGGYYGGGGGGSGSSISGGGSEHGQRRRRRRGGSSYAEPNAQNVHFWRAWQKATGDGLIVLELEVKRLRLTNALSLRRLRALLHD